MELREKTINSKEIYKGRVISLSVDTVITPGGNEATREIVHHPGGVAVVAIDNDDMIYLVEQYRVPYDDILLEIPAGKLDSKDEDPKDAALRELSEETGLTCKEIKHIGDFTRRLDFLTKTYGSLWLQGFRKGKPTQTMTNT